jgi:gamma-glutamylcyclotransferase
MPSQYYFAYGSNLSIAQMTQRCPDSIFVGIAQLHDYKWIINERGHANVVKQGNSKPSGHVVWGLVFNISEDDVALLDKYESVPELYVKEALEVDFWPANSPDGTTDTQWEPETLVNLVYVDKIRTTEADIRSEYIYRMSYGLSDALKSGIPEEYIISRLLSPIHAGRKNVGPLWEKYLDAEGNPVPDEVPVGSDGELGVWLARLFAKIQALGEAWGTKGRPNLVDDCVAD